MSLQYPFSGAAGDEADDEQEPPVDMLAFVDSFWTVVDAEWLFFKKRKHI